jgi:8-oxo-dGTP diphosphatase
VHRVTQFNGEPHGKEGQPSKWQSLSDLNSDEFPAANKPIIQALALL